ncbi:hypothetical protein RHGRI_008502 [Rhododendron griersonianum]|uniref:Anaphase-promoting complex subunit 4-like WD40 domain-containing protein n=1 Tax=Rhododendron griersonianum TaxID=479676 RepID=A0AAV6L0S4_9ERIC|nr:hypothetical protein RHGRI_008502 [Rhododendron griersonianum]
MRREREREPANCKKYGIPLYGASWISDDNYLVFAGGGGEGRSGIPNVLLLARFDFESNCLNDQPVAKLGTGSDLPYRMAVHPGGDGVICSLPKSCRCFEWDTVKSTDGKKLGLKPSDKVIDELEDVGQQLALIFNNDGSVLALGGEDGKLRVFKWPSMEIILDVSNAHASVKDLDFSPDGKFLVSVGSGGPGRVWDVTSSKAVASLSKEQDEVFGFCRFSHSEKNPVLYITAMRVEVDSSLNISKSVTTACESMSLSPVLKKRPKGDVLIITSANMHVQNVVRKAHLGLVTALMFSQDSRALVSASLDSSARVTMIKDARRNGLSLWIIVLVILLAIAGYYVKTKGILH